MTSASDYTVRPVRSVEELQAALDVRMKVFTDEQGFAADVEIDSHDPGAIHFIIYPTADSSKIIGTVRYVPYPYAEQSEELAAASVAAFPQNGVKEEADVAALFRMAADRNSADTTCAGAKLGRLCLLKEARGKKLGEKAVQDSEKCLQEAQDERVKRIQYLASSQMYAVGFYEKWVPVISPRR